MRLILGLTVTDQTTEGTWVGIDGITLEYTDWFTDGDMAIRPLVSDGRNCVNWRHGGGFMGWYDVPCDEARPFICKAGTHRWKVLVVHKYTGTLPNIRNRSMQNVF